MKAIIKENKKLSLKLKAAFALFVLAAAGAFLFSLKFVGKAKNEFPELDFSESIKLPECSHTGGFYKCVFSIKLTSSEPNTEIYYTTDGSEPSLLSSPYLESITIENRTGNRNYLSAIPTSPRWKPPIGNVFKGTVIRAISIETHQSDGQKKYGKSKELVRTFFVDESSNKKYTLPVISITVNQNDLFGYKNGIYVLGSNYLDKDNYIRKNIPLDLAWWDYPANYLLKGDDAERKAHIEFFEPNGALGFEANVGLRIHGNATRGFSQKSLRICFREKYGQTQLTYDLFENNKNEVFNSFILRNSGNDWSKTMFRDAFMQSLLQHSYIDIQDYRPSIVFINGEYWGIHNIRERFDENYLANKYHLNVDSITILELSGKLMQGSKQDEESFSELLDFVKKNDLSTDKNFEFVKSKIDIRSFTDFVIANVYYNNSDWPNNNVKFWKYDANADSVYVKDGRWRWMLYDTDWGFGYNSMSTPESNLLEKATKIGSVGTLFSGLIKNKTFLDEFLARFQYHLYTTFESEGVIKKIDEMAQVLSPEMKEHINRWRAIGSYSEWLSNIEVLRAFAQQRPQFQANQLNVFFNLKGDKQITIKNSSKAY